MGKVMAVTIHIHEPQDGYSWEWAVSVPGETGTFSHPELVNAAGNAVAHAFRKKLFELVKDDAKEPQ